MLTHYIATTNFLLLHVTLMQWMLCIVYIYLYVNSSECQILRSPLQCTNSIERQKSVPIKKNYHQQKYDDIFY